MLFIIEIGMFIYGIYALATGKFSLGRKGIATGTQARIAGGIFMLALPSAFFVGFIYGVLMAMGLFPSSGQAVVGIVIDLGIIIAFYFISRVVAEKGLPSTDVIDIPNPSELNE